MLGARDVARNRAHLLKWFGVQSGWATWPADCQLIKICEQRKHVSAEGVDLPVGPEHTNMNGSEFGQSEL